MSITEGEVCHICDRPNPQKVVVTEALHMAVCDCHVGDVLGDVPPDNVIDVIPNY